MKKGQIMSRNQLEQTTNTQLKNGESVKDLTSEIVRRLRTVLSEKNMSQSRLGEKTGIGKATISKWFTGDSAISLLNLYKVANALDVSIDSLCGLNTKNTQRNIESFKDLLTSIWKQCIFCDENNLQFIVNEGEVVFDNVDFELAVANDDLKRPKFLNIYIENNQVQEFLKNLNTFKGLYKNGTITKEQFNDFMESQIEKLALKNEEEKRNKESKM